MEMRLFAERLLGADTLKGKLSPPGGLTDNHPGAPLRLPKPTRPPGLEIRPGREVRVPPIAGMHDPHQRARILHALANHELQAAELCAWALCAFPRSPPAFRRGLVSVLGDEQRHMALYLDRLATHDVSFGDFPVTGHFWNKLPGVRSPLGFVATLGLTFENANLDFALAYAAAATEAGDHDTAAVLKQVHEDEVRHVKLAYHWLRALSPEDQAPLDTYAENVASPLSLGRARGKSFDTQSRIAAGLDDDFIAALAAAGPVRPSGEPR